jgi:hypothetical protein
MTPEAPQSLNDFQPPEAIAGQFPQFSESSIRWWLRERRNNGLAPHVRKIGKKVYLHVPGFMAWINSRTA